MMPTAAADRGPEDHHHCGGGLRAGEKPAHLEPSELGTKEYWDALYERELRNHAHDPGDRGTVWFEDADAEARVVGFLRRRHRALLQLPPSPPRPDRNRRQQQKPRDDHDDATDNKEGRKQEKEEEGISFLDLGTGNGSLLFGLRDAAADDDDDDDDGDEDGDGDAPRPFAKGRMLGVDYSARSVEFARRIARSRRRTQAPAQTQTQNGNRDTAAEEEEEEEEEGDADADVEFQLHDILRDPAARLLTGAQAAGWDVVLDKGTFDAVSLAPPSPSSAADRDDNDSGGSSRGREGEGQREREAEAYPRRVLPLVRDGGLLVVTSCNWTEDELRRWFEGAADAGPPAAACRFEQVARVEYPSFRFGGVQGQAISTLCFRKVRGGR